MLSLLLLALAADTVTICAVDAQTHAPVIGVSVASDGRRTRGDTSIARRPAAGACVRVVAEQVTLRRIGYHERVVTIPLGTQRMTVVLQPVGAVPAYDGGNGGVTSTSLDTTHIVASATTAGVGRLSETLDTDRIRDAGNVGVGGLVAALPFALPRSMRSDVGLSLRGARPEQVVVTFDGVPLNDPATGRADIADIPLIAIGTATLLLGAAPLSVGSGASGGVLALSSATDRAISASIGAFGSRTIEAGLPLSFEHAVLHIGGSLLRARNDFSFVNDAGATNASVMERRINNDVTRGSLFASLVTPRAQVTMLATGSDMGMVGPVNVHDYDQDRASATRVLLRAVTQLGSAQVIAGARGMSLRYHDPARAAFDNVAHAGAADLEARGLWRAVQWRIGVGGDAVRADHDVHQDRQRAFGALTWERHARATSVDVGVRADLVQFAGAQPSFSAALERRFRHVDFGARVAQALRVPTLYDLYFASPQRLIVRALVPEHVVFDGELLARLRASNGRAALSLEGALVSRDTRNAIVWFPGNFSWSPANVGRERMQGVESRVRVVAPFVDVSLWTTWYDASLTSGSLLIPTPYVPRLASGGTVQWSHGSWRVHTAFHAMDRRPFTVGPRDPAYELPAVQLVDVSLAREQRIGRARAMESIGVENAGNARWQSVRGFPSPGRAWSLGFTLFTTSNN